MNHRPFEDWLLNDTPINPEQKRELDIHLRTCSYCAALVETGVALKTVKKASPQAGFTARFEARLAARKAAERRRRYLGSILFTAGGFALLIWVASPYLLSFFSAPATWISVVVDWMVFLITTLQALGQAGSVLLDVVPEFLPPFAWMIVISAVAGIGLLWTISIWRFVREPRGR
jgi:anti-sigma factor RsiW